MFIRIAELTDEPLHVRNVYGRGELAFQRTDAALDEPVSVDFTLTHKDLDLRLGGRVETTIRYTCARCVREFATRLSTSFDLVYLPQPKTAEPDEEIELKYEDMDVGFYDGIRLDVDQMIVEQIELAMPMRFVCREDCRGLCYKCGADLNEGPCNCTQDVADPRLAVLREFRKKLES